MKKKLTSIPKGTYCYEIAGITYGDNGMPCVKTRMCPYYRKRSGGWCSLEKDEIMDCCKMCGENEGLNLTRSRHANNSR